MQLYYRLYRRVPLSGLCLFGVEGEKLHVERVLRADDLVLALQAGDVDRVRDAVKSGDYLLALHDDLDPFLREANVCDVADVFPRVTSPKR